MSLLKTSTVRISLLVYLLVLTARVYVAFVVDG